MPCQLCVLSAPVCSCAKQLCGAVQCGALDQNLLPKVTELQFHSHGGSHEDTLFAKSTFIRYKPASPAQHDGERMHKYERLSAACAMCHAYNCFKVDDCILGCKCIGVKSQYRVKRYGNTAGLGSCHQAHIHVFLHTLFVLHIKPLRRTLCRTTWLSQDPQARTLRLDLAKRQSGLIERSRHVCPTQNV